MNSDLIPMGNRPEGLIQKVEEEEEIVVINSYEIYAKNKH
jgi:hypothetical protein